MNKGDGNSGKGSDVNHIFMAGQERLLLDWIWSVRGSEKPSVSHQSSWVDSEAINWAGKDQGKKRDRDLPEAEMGSKEATALHFSTEGPECKITSHLYHSKWGSLCSEASRAPQRLEAMMMSVGTEDVGDQPIPDHKTLEHGGRWGREKA